MKKFVFVLAVLILSLSVTSLIKYFVTASTLKDESDEGNKTTSFASDLSSVQNNNSSGASSEMKLSSVSIEKVSEPPSDKTIGSSQPVEQILGVGNSNWNIMNGAIIASQGEWLYFYDYSNDYSLTKMKKDLGEKTVLVKAMCNSINVLGDWVYYVNRDDKDSIYRVKNDGTDNTKLSSDQCIFIYLVNGYIYYQEYNNRHIYSMKIDGSNKVQVVNDSADCFCVSDNWIYYTTVNDPVNLYKINTDGSAKTNLGIGNVGKFTVEKDTIYYCSTSASGFFSVKTDGTANTRLNKVSLINGINKFGEWLYCTDVNENLYIMKTDGSNKRFLSKERCFGISVIDDRIYYMDTKKFYRMKPDGTDIQVINSFNAIRGGF